MLDGFTLINWAFNAAVDEGSFSAAGRKLRRAIGVSHARTLRLCTSDESSRERLD